MSEPAVLSEVTGCCCGQAHLLTAGGLAAFEQVTAGLDPLVPKDRLFTGIVLACLECGDPEHPLPMPFASPAERGRWASEHTRATGHDRWVVEDQPAEESRDDG